MQDIDFDEIDRAVNSVTNPTSPTDTSSTDAPSDSTPAPSSLPGASPTPPSPAARRSSGRFMDVVHPSSDMRSGGVPERSAPREEPKKPLFDIHFVAGERNVEEDEKPSQNWPDPLDFQGFKMDDTPEAPTEAPAAPEEQSDDIPQTPLESPFITDAKVEKRPLGAFSVAEEEKPVVNMPEEKPTEEELLLEAPDPEPLLEAGDTQSEKAPEEAPVVGQTPEPAVETTPEPITAPEEPTGPTSITQQYKEQPSSTDAPSGAIYDTEAYHQALTHTPKKKSGALVVVWIAALILVGGGAGAAVYFFVLPML